jgi:hypothetical protein
MSEDAPVPEREPKWPDRTWTVLILLALSAAILSAFWP